MARFWVQDKKCVAQGRKCNDRAQTHKIIGASIYIRKVENLQCDQCCDSDSIVIIIVHKLTQRTIFNFDCHFVGKTKDKLLVFTNCLFLFSRRIFLGVPCESSQWKETCSQTDLSQQ